MLVLNIGRWLLLFWFCGCSLNREPTEADYLSGTLGENAGGGPSDASTSGGDGDDNSTTTVGDFWGGPCSDDDATTACASGVGDSGNDPACFDGDGATVCPDLPQDVTGDGDGDASSGNCGRECDDAAFCNGVGHCSPGDPAADGDGCVIEAACSTGEACIEATRSCAPCADNDDPDGDGYRDVGCGGDDCDEGNPNVNPGATEVCNGIDDDCDGVVDGEPAKADCPAGFPLFMKHAFSVACVEATCVVDACQPGWYDCNGLLDDGCEHDVNPVRGDCMVTNCLGHMVIDNNETDNGNECLNVSCTNGVPSESANTGGMCLLGSDEGRCDSEARCQPLE